MIHYVRKCVMVQAAFYVLCVSHLPSLAFSLTVSVCGWRVAGRKETRSPHSRLLICLPLPARARWVHLTSCQNYLNMSFRCCVNVENFPLFGMYWATMFQLLVSVTCRRDTYINPIFFLFHSFTFLILCWFCIYCPFALVLVWEPSQIREWIDWWKISDVLECCHKFN